MNFEPLGLPCEEPDCFAEAVRHCCNAEGDAGRTHWHGGIHHIDPKKEGRYYCKEHGLKHLKANALIKKQCR